MNKLPGGFDEGFVLVLVLLLVLETQQPLPLWSRTRTTTRTSPEPDVTPRPHRFTHLALKTGSTRLITIMLAGSTAAPPIGGVSPGHHDLSHQGKDAGKLAQLKIVEIEAMKTVRDLLTKLRQSKEDDSNLLDRTSVFLQGQEVCLLRSAIGYSVARILHFAFFILHFPETRRPCAIST